MKPRIMLMLLEGTLPTEERENGEKEKEGNGVKKARKERAEVNARDEQGRTALHFMGSIECTEILLQHGADVNAMDLSGRTPLHVAAEGGFLRTMESLLAHGADPNGLHHPQRSDVASPLVVAFLGEHVRVADVLLLNGADHTIGAPDDPTGPFSDILFDRYPLAIACQVCNPLPASFLLPTSAISLRFPSPQKRSLDLLELLLAVGQSFSLEFAEWIKDRTSRRIYTTLLKVLRTNSEISK